jgi:hypothetical protein
MDASLKQKNYFFSVFSAENAGIASFFQAL